MKDLIVYMTQNLVENPDAVEVKEIAGERTAVYELRVHPDDLGRIIGRNGKTAKAIRTVLSAASLKADRRVILEIIN